MTLTYRSDAVHVSRVVVHEPLVMAECGCGDRPKPGPEWLRCHVCGGDIPSRVDNRPVVRLTRAQIFGEL